MTSGSRLRRLAPVLWLGLWAAVALAADEPLSFRVFIQPERGITSDTPLQLVLQLEGQRLPQLAPPRLGDLKNLRVIRGPETRVNSMWTNGRASATYQVIYTLLPEKPGPAEIPAMTLTVDARTYTSEPIRFAVGQPAAAGAQPQGQPGPSGPVQGGGAERADIFVQARISADEVWVGQPVFLSLTLYTAQRVQNANFTTEPALDDFWVEDITVDPNAEVGTSVIGGRRYQAYPLKRKWLVPQTAGEYEIGSWALQMEARSERAGPFDLFSFGRLETIVRRSPPLKLRVKALPAAGSPPSFAGPVGSFTLRASMDRQQAQVNDAVALTAVVEGRGFLKLAPPPVFEAPRDVKTLDPKVSVSYRMADGNMLSKKTWEWVIVPLVQGELKLPDLRFDYFDPASASFKSARSAPPALVVERGEGTPDARAAHGDIQLQRHDIKFIKPLRGELREGSPRAHRRGLYLALLLLPLLWVPLVVLLGRQRVRLQQNRGLARARRARARARKRLQAARRLLPAEDPVPFHQEVARALVEHVADRFDRSPAGLSYELADELLAGRGVDADLRRRFRACLETCDFARFVPAAAKTERRTEVLEEAQRLVDQLERAL